MSELKGDDDFAISFNTILKYSEALSKEQKSKTPSEAQMDAKKTPAKNVSTHIEDQEDFKEFLELLRLTGKMTLEFADLPLEEKKSIEVGYHQWVKADKPKPTMPDLPKSRIEYPIDIWIAKSKGKTWMYYDTNLGRKLEIEEQSGKIVKYLQEFSVENMTALLKEREELCPLEQPRHQYIILGTQTHLVEDELSLLKGYDTVAEHIRTGKAIA